MRRRIPIALLLAALLLAFAPAPVANAAPGAWAKLVRRVRGKIARWRGKGRTPAKAPAPQKAATKKEVYISIDVEADGPIPGDYSMQSIGATVVGAPGKTFYRELKPISRRSVASAASVGGLDRRTLKKKGAKPKAAMQDFAKWVRSVAGDAKPVFVGFNAAYDWSFVNWYMHHFTGGNPFGHSALDLKALYMGALGKKTWSETSKRNLDRAFRGKPLDHNALGDAREQADLFVKLRDLLERK